MGRDPTPKSLDPEPSLTPSQDAGSLASLLGAVARTGHSALAEGTLVADQYRVARPIGEGGMGVVYLARDETLDRAVAVKLCTGLSASAVHRIQREAMALAKLAHPNVVVVHQAGEIDGRFFIAMEHVAGGTASTWLAERERSVAEIVALYAAAGDGLAAAHDAGLVHRDFKPDNVLVGADGRPRVADFGLARAVQEAELREAATADSERGHTQAGAVMGTLAYMPPEQLDGEVVDARADQYAFAVSLWEALFGARPSRSDTVAIHEGAKRPEPLLRATGDAVPKHIVAALQRALADDREQRWPDMNALLAELRRDPASKRRRAIAVAGAIALVASGAATASIWSEAPAAPLQCTDAPSQIADVWNGERSAAIALVVGDAAWPAIEQRLRTRVDEWIVQHQAACRATRIDGSASEDVLDVRMLCLEERKQELEAILRVLEHGSAMAVSEAAGAIDLLPGSADCMSSQPYGGDSLPSDPVVRDRISTAQGAVAEANAASLDPSALDAIEKANRAVELAEATQWRPIVAKAFATRGAALHEMYRRREALDAYRHAVELAIAAGSDELAVQALADGAQAQAELGQTGEAAQALAIAHALWERTGRNAETGQRLLMGVANVAWEDERAEDALEAMLQQVELAERVFGDAATSQATNQYNLAIAYHRVGRRRESEEALERAIAIAREALGDDHPTVGKYVGLAAQHAMRHGELARSHELATQALAILEESLGRYDPRLVVVLEVLGSVAMQRGEFEVAKAHHVRALEIRRRTDPDGPELAGEEANLAIVMVQTGDFATAAPLAESAVGRFEQSHGPQSPMLVDALILRGYIARQRPDPDLDASLRDMTRAREISIAAHGEDAPETINAEIELANTLMARREHAKAVAMLDAKVAELGQLALPIKVAGELRLALAQALAPGGSRQRMCELARQAEEDLRAAEVPPLVATATAWRSEHCR